MTRTDRLPARRALLRAALLTGAAAMTTPVLAACTRDPDRQTSGQATTAPAPEPSRKPRGILLAYFSRPGENYYYGDRTDLKTGNTEVLARKLHNLIDCDLYRIEAADPYPHDYDATVQRNVREQDTDARPAIKDRLPDLTGYGTILLASPIWNVRAPMIMTTFTDGLDFRGKTVRPVTTYAMSGLGTTERDYAASRPGATIAPGLAVQGEKVRDADTEVEAWLRRIGLSTR
ncbi:flavodoxin [Streptomyces sp. AM 2-1-1]|uniref:flavodoxin n=1 Tax=Streptomyces sp. AM 2-1-1 TaxID=3028709 RepID=UPI0023B9BAA8|nr:flavodoxin [Streptomyces sp. AM 2-1-1]WEH40276.1 flavodoxin [Streptomyces sp. AM 2-1-1]